MSDKQNNEARRGMHMSSFPYNEDLRSVMVSPVLTCAPDTTIKAASAEMSKNSTSSVVVVDTEGKPIGIVTAKDILNRVVATDGIDTATTPISAVMTPNPITLKPEDTVYRALSVLSENPIKHLPIIKGDIVAGIVTSSNLLRLRHAEPMVLISGIAEAETVADLKEIKDRLPELVAMKLNLSIDSYDTVAMLSLINQDIHRKTLELAILKHGTPPLGLCLFVMGSHGRRENLLSPDQDHGMIIADSEDSHLHDKYFMELTDTLSRWLDEIGFVTCPGYIMSVNPLWRKTVSEWKHQLQYWFERQVPHLARYITLLFDATPVYGDEALFKSLNDFAYSLMGTHHEVLRLLLEEESSHRPPLGLFGRFITENTPEARGVLDIKRSGLIFIIEGVRLLALRHGVRETRTVDRISKLTQKGVVNADDAENLDAAYRLFLSLALKSQVEKAKAGTNINTYIRPGSLSSRQRRLLRNALKAVDTIQGIVASEFGRLAL